MAKENAKQNEQTHQVLPSLRNGQSPEIREGLPSTEHCVVLKGAGFLDEHSDRVSF